MTLAALVVMIAAQAPVSGQVVDASGRPASGVEIFLSGWPGRGAARAGLTRTKSDPEGRFRIDVPVEKDPDRAGFPRAVWAYDPDKGISGQVLSRSALPAAGSVKLKLAGPARTAVRVVGPDGRPVPAARLFPTSVHVDNPTRQWPTFSPPEALTDLLA